MYPETYLELHRQRERELEARLAWALAHRERSGAVTGSTRRPVAAAWHRVAAAAAGVPGRVRAATARPAGFGPAAACCPAV
ncbi:hypothetical protein [Cellulomonas fimi]|uniref:tRNA (Guanine-N(1)-)-methyltransferase n=1 Tax=Cellulomonas fimi (strain ATCC 484 / DSM 20113 / JCM 1341 / CCUG 24087 / LMG 16345 / NBRC 15513 / NCIMB 8980 / NCTC 7547 / NRS-133) TaxID=590998 RepID=F4H4F9_CELFA|nr:hypothetical protein [Cellulomonas fimi]AEE47754.1 tRNA (guanine-N(1)-)-methyltransferase [Cellulomonas fimi ATCC 484]NNH06707.1 hypothetical protein [Cellulomonas fimi]VEH36937.1 Uncharacterised protein [Cellulomonas fimi]